MDSRLLVFIAIACGVTRIESQMMTPTALTTNITRNGCGTTKLCFTTCDPQANTSTCYFGSSQSTSNTTLYFELSGPTSGYVALGLGTTQNVVSIVFVCGNNNNSLFFTTATNSSNSLNSSNVNTVYSVQGALSGNQSLNQSLIQCTFNTSSNLTSNLTTTRSPSTSFWVWIFNGTTTGTNLGFFNTLFNSTTILDLTNPKSNIANSTNNTNSTNSTTSPSTSGSDPLANPVARVLAIMLSAVGILLLY